jgi:hypothetical protein
VITLLLILLAAYLLGCVVALVWLPVQWLIDGHPEPAVSAPFVVLLWPVLLPDRIIDGKRLGGS